MTRNANLRVFLIFAGPFIALAGLIALFDPTYRNLALLFLFTIAANNVIPMPYEPVMIGMGALYPPLIAATVAACGNLAACLIDYEAIGYAFRHRALQQVQRGDMYRGAVHYFLKAPFFCIAIAAFAPFIPFYIFRVLSPTSRYPIGRYMAAVFLGRWPRYYLFAFLGSALLPTNLLIACAILLVVCIGLYMLVRHHLIARARLNISLARENVRMRNPPVVLL